MSDILINCVGDHTFSFENPKELLSEKKYSNYASFKTAFSFGESLLFHLSLTQSTDSIQVQDTPDMHFEDENGTIAISVMQDRNMTVSIATPSLHQCCSMLISGDFHHAKVWIRGSEAERLYALDSALMLLYTFASSKFDTLLIHASAVEYDGKAFLFLGKSGTGKSTHSRLWLDHISGAILLNDDNPIVRIIDGKAYAYGSPWSGKTPCYKNRRLPLAGIVRLKQASENRMSPISGIKAYAALLPSCSGMKLNHEMAEDIHSTISKVIESVPVYTLECRPDKEAAILCHQKFMADNIVGTHGSCVCKSI